MSSSASPAYFSFTRVDRSPSETTPTRRLSLSSTGRRRICFVPMASSTVFRSSSAKAVCGSRVIYSTTAALEEAPWARARTVRSRSVIVPIRVSPSATGMKPKSPAAMREATSWTVSPGRATWTSLLITSRTFIGVSPLSEAAVRTPAPAAGSGRQHDCQTTRPSGSCQAAHGLLGPRSAVDRNDEEYDYENRHDPEGPAFHAGGVGGHDGHAGAGPERHLLHRRRLARLQPGLLWSGLWLWSELRPGLWLQPRRLWRRS